MLLIEMDNNGNVIGVRRVTDDGQELPPEEYEHWLEQDVTDHAAGWDAGGPVDPTKSASYQRGQEARMEDAAEKPFWKRMLGL